jgi:hypothetical protein
MGRCCRKVFWGDIRKFSKAADAFYARRRWRLIDAIKRDEIAAAPTACAQAAQHGQAPASRRERDVSANEGSRLSASIALAAALARIALVRALHAGKAAADALASQVMMLMVHLGISFLTGRQATKS